MLAAATTNSSQSHKESTASKSEQMWPTASKSEQMWPSIADYSVSPLAILSSIVFFRDMACLQSG
jgi:hypothetical protein